jgi:glycosyltransferase involved in cell wall biosynthesis
MKILQLVQRPQRRGAEVFAHQLNRTLHSFGHEVRTIYLYAYSGESKLPVNNGDIVLDGNEAHFFERVPGVHPTLLRSLLKEINRFQPDIVQVNGARTVKYGAFARKASPQAKWRLVYRNIGNPKDWLNDPWRRWFYAQLVMPSIHGIIGISQVTLQGLHSVYDLKIPLVTIPNGIDPIPLAKAPTQQAARQQLGVPQGATILLFMGSLSAEKRPDRFIRIVHRLREHSLNVQGWLLGDGTLRADLEEQVQTLDLQEEIRFLGYQTEIAQYLSAADLLLLTSDTEGIPAVVLEAGFMGKPVIASRVGGLPECVQDTKTGFLVEPSDDQAFVNAVLQLCRNPQQRITMAQCAQEWVRSKFTIETVAQQYVDFFQQVLTK